MTNESITQNKDELKEKLIKAGFNKKKLYGKSLDTLNVLHDIAERRGMFQ